MEGLTEGEEGTLHDPGEDQSKSRVYRGETLKVGANEFKGVRELLLAPSRPPLRLRSSSELLEGGVKDSSCEFLEGGEADGQARLLGNTRLTSSSPLDSVRREGARGVSTIMWVHLAASICTEWTPASPRRPRTIHRCILKTGSAQAGNASSIACHVCGSQHRSYRAYFSHLMDSSCSRLHRAQGTTRESIYAPPPSASHQSTQQWRSSPSPSEGKAGRASSPTSTSRRAPESEVQILGVAKRPSEADGSIGKRRRRTEDAEDWSKSRRQQWATGAGLRMDSRSCTSSPTQHPVALEASDNPASEPSNSSHLMSTETNHSKVSSTIQQSTPSGKYLAATSNNQQPALPASRSEEVGTNRVEEERAAGQGEVEDEVGDSNQELSKFDEVAASESLLMLSGGGGAGGGAGEKAGSGMQEPEIAAFSLPVMCPCQAARRLPPIPDQEQREDKKMHSDFLGKLRQLMTLLLGDRRLQGLGYPGIPEDQVLAKILRLTGTSVTKEDSLCSPHCKVSPPLASQQEARMLKSRMAALELNTEAFLRICTPDPVIWEKFGWVGKDVHAIISQIAESGLPK